MGGVGEERLRGGDVFVGGDATGCRAGELIMNPRGSCCCNGCWWCWWWCGNFPEKEDDRFVLLVIGGDEGEGMGEVGR